MTVPVGPADGAADAGRRVLALRRTCVLAVGPVVVLGSGVIHDALDKELTVAPVSLALGYLVLAVLGMAAAVLAAAAAIRVRRGLPPNDRLDDAWRRLAAAGAMCFVVVSCAWAAARIVWGTQVAAWEPTAVAAPLTSLYLAMILLAVGGLSLRRAVVVTVGLMPVQVLLNSPPGGMPDGDAWFNAGYFSTQALMMLGVFIWLANRSRRRDEAEAALGAEARLLTEERTATVARHRADDFIRDDILSVLGPVATGRVTEEVAAAEAQRALDALSADDGVEAPVEVWALVEEIRSEVEGRTPGGAVGPERAVPGGGCGTSGLVGVARAVVGWRLGMRGALWVVGAMVVFHLAGVVAFLDAYAVAWVSPACLAVLLGCTYLVMRRWGGSMPVWAACVVAVGMVIAEAAQAVVLPESTMPGWERWTTAACTTLACGLLLRNRRRAAWAAMGGVIAVTAIWVAANGLSWATVAEYHAGHVLTVAMWQAVVMWAERARRAIDAQESRSRALRLRRQVEEETQRVMRRTRTRLVGSLRPLLERIAAGAPLDEELRTTAGLEEACLRDEMRAACFAGTPVEGAARRARRRGVDVVLMDDSGRPPGAEDAEHDRVVRAVVEALDDSESGRVVVRVPPRSRADAVVVTRDGEPVVRVKRKGS